MYLAFGQRVFLVVFAVFFGIVLVAQLFFVVFFVRTRVFAGGIHCFGCVADISLCSFVGPTAFEQKHETLLAGLLRGRVVRVFVFVVDFVVVLGVFGVFDYCFVIGQRDLQTWR